MKKTIFLSIFLSLVFSFCSLTTLTTVYAFSKSDASSCVYVGELYTNKMFNQSKLNVLYKYISGKENATFDDIKELAQIGYNASDFRETIISSGDENGLYYQNKNSNQSVVVKLGGITWQAVSLLTDKNDDVVLTLFMDTIEQDAFKSENKGTNYLTNNGILFSKFSNGFSRDNALYTYPGNMYGTSYIRAITLNNGGKYLSYCYDSTLKNATQDIDNPFAIFTMSGIENSLVEFIDTPSLIAYQETESAKNDLNSYRDNNNDAYGSLSSDNFYYDTNKNINYNYSLKQGYDSWKNDYLWLPSYVELGSYTDIGLWELNQEEKSCYDTKTQNISEYTEDLYTSFWLRSAAATSTTYVYNGNVNGEYNFTRLLSSYGAVRPCIHLNLSKANKKTCINEQNSISTLYKDWFNVLHEKEPLIEKNNISKIDFSRTKLSNFKEENYVFVDGTYMSYGNVLDETNKTIFCYYNENNEKYELNFVCDNYVRFPNYSDNLFANLTSLTELNMCSMLMANSIWSANGMFANLQSLTALDLSLLNFENIVSANDMFKDTLNLEILKTPNKTSYTCIQIPNTMIDSITGESVSEININNASCTFKKEINNGVLSYSWVSRFIGSKKINSAIFTNVLPENYKELTSYCINSISQDENTLCDWKNQFADIVLFVKPAQNNSKLKDAIVYSCKEIIFPIYAESMFYGCTYIKKIAFDCDIDLSSTEGLYYFCQGCVNLERFEINGEFNTENVNDFSCMFDGCLKLNYIDVDKFDTKNMLYGYNMFSSCSSLKSLDLSNWNTANNYSFQFMFAACKSLTEIDVSSFEFSNVCDGGLFAMFGCTKEDCMDYFYVETMQEVRNELMGYELWQDDGCADNFVEYITNPYLKTIKIKTKTMDSSFKIKLATNFADQTNSIETDEIKHTDGDLPITYTNKNAPDLPVVIDYDEEDDDGNNGGVDGPTIDPKDYADNENKGSTTIKVLLIVGIIEVCAVFLVVIILKIKKNLRSIGGEQ